MDNKLIFLGVLLLAAVVFAQTNITACGTYSTNNEVYVITQDLTANNANCLTFNGTNQTINGQWHTLWVTNEAGLHAVVTISGNNITFENATITGGCWGVLFYSSSANIRNLDVSGQVTQIGCAGISIPSSNVSANLTTIYVHETNTINAISSASTASGQILNFTNVVAESPNYGLDMEATSSTFIDGGYNYWANCTGSCSWYTITRTTNEICQEDTCALSSHPDTNYGTATQEPNDGSTGDRRDFFRHCRNLSMPPGRVISSIVLWFYGGGYCPDGTTYDYLIDLDGSKMGWSENTTTWNNQPNNWPTVGTNLNLACGYHWVSLNYPIDYNNEVLYKDNYGLYSFSRTKGVYFHENGTYAPYRQLTWRYACGNYNKNIVYSCNLSSCNATIWKQILTTPGAVYCSVSIPNNASIAIYNLTSGQSLNPTLIYDAYNSTYNWVSFAVSAYQFYNVVSTQIMDKIIVDTVCPIGFSDVYSISFLDESNNVATQGNATLVFVGNNLNLTKTVSNVSNFKICLYPDFHGQASTTITYNGANYATRNYYITFDENSSGSITLYQIPASVASYITFKTQNQFAQPLKNRKQYYMRYFISDNTYKLVAMGITDDDGFYTAPLFTNDGSAVYKIISYAEDGTTIEKTFSKETVYCTAGQACEHYLIISSTQELPEYWISYYGKVIYNCTDDMANKQISCTYTDSSGESHTFDLQLFRLGLGNPVSLCNTSSTSAAATLTCTISENTTGNIYAWRFTRHSEQTIITNGLWDYREAAFKMAGLGVSLLILAASFAIGLFNPAAAVIFGSIGLIMSNLMGLIQIDITAIAGVVLVAVFLAWRFSSR